MSVISKLRVWFGADTAEAEKGFKRIEKKGSELDKSFDKLKGTITAAFSVAAISAFLKECYQLAEIQWKAEKRLEAGLKATGNAVGYTAKELKKYASALQQVTLFGDEVTLGAMARLVPYTNVTGDVFKKTIALAQDLATVMDTDLNSAVVKLGKALNTPGKGLDELREAGIAFTQEQVDGIQKLVSVGDIYNAQLSIIEEVYRHVGGAAAEMATGADQAFAAVTMLKNAWGDFLETIGTVLPLGMFASALAFAFKLESFLPFWNKSERERQANIAKAKKYEDELNKTEEQRVQVLQKQKTELELVQEMNEESIKALDEKISAYDKLMNVTSVLDSASLVYYQNEITRLKNLKAEYTSLAETKTRVAGYRASSGSVTAVSAVDASMAFNKQQLTEMANKEIASWAEDLDPIPLPITIDDTSMISFGNSIATIIEGWSQSLGDVISGNFQPESLLKPVATVCQQMGSMLIAYGVGMDAFKKALSNPWAAIAAGAALVAIGTAISNYANNVGEKMASSSAAGGGSSYSTQLSAYKDSKMEISGTLKADGDELVAVINNVNNRNKYIR